MNTDSVSSLKGVPVLVTGAQGFIGSHLVQRLIAAGADTHVVSRAPWTDIGVPLRAWTCDLRDAEKTDRLISAVKPAVIFHLASQVTGKRDLGLVLPLLEANLRSAVNMLTAATRHGSPRVVLAGSVEEIRPGEEAAPSSPYAASKSAVTAYAQMFHALWGLPTVVLRIAMVYGPQQSDALKLIPYVTTSLLTGRTPKLTSGERKIDWIYIDDVVEAFVAAAQNRDAAGGVFDIGSGAAHTIRRTVEMINEIVGSASHIEFGALDDRPLDHARIAHDNGAATILRWKPQVDLHEGLLRTVDWYRNRQI